MGGWLEKIIGTSIPAPKAGNLPTQAAKSRNLPAQPLKPGTPLPPNLPNATVIYGIGASLMFVAAFSLLLAGRWFPGFMVLLIGGCFVGFALHLLKHQD